MIKHVNLPLTEEDVKELRAGDEVLLSGVLYTARDAAHQRLCKLIDEGKELPFDIKGALIYYVGPTPAKPGRPVGSAGPTTSSRMDGFAPKLIACGLRGMLGKGGRSQEVIEAMKRYGCIYFAAIGGAGALMAKAVKSAEVIAWEDLGCEALRRMEVENLQAYVAIDAEGGSLYH